MIRIALGVSLALGIAGPASAQTLTLMKGIDAPHYDAQRTTWGPTSDIVNMFQDTLVALDWDGKTPIPYLAKSWTISEDGRTYTFKLRDDVSFCSGKKFTADDVVYSFKRLKDPAIKGPYAWRAGPIKELRATDPHTVEYELEEPFSELLLQLTMFTNVIHNKDSVEALGKDYGIKGADGTGPWCFDHWHPRTEIVLKRHDAYKWGPSMYQNKGPVKFEKLVVKIIPEDSSRVAAMMSGQFDITHQFPAQFITQAKAAPMLTVTPARAEFPVALLRLQDDPADGGRSPRARSHEHRHQPRRDRQSHPARQRRSGFHLRRSGRTRLRPQDQGDRQGRHRTGESAARRSRLEAGYRRRAREGRHEARSRRSISPPMPTRRASPRPSRAISGRSASTGACNPGTRPSRSVKMAEQDYEIWSVTVPYLSAGDLMNIYFDSANIPTPNRMNWKDAETDAWLKQGRSALTEADRAKYYALVQQKVTREHLWMPVLNINMDQVANKKITGARPHMIYQNTFYKGLDVTR